MSMKAAARGQATVPGRDYDALLLKLKDALDELDGGKA